MTGETNGIKKVVPKKGEKLDQSKVNSFLLSGSRILEGNGKMVICATGENSQFGILKKKIQGSND